MKVNPKTENHRKGSAGEAAAADFYLQNGYEIRARNWRWGRKGEIDLIAYHKKDGIHAICEVKTRSLRGPVWPCEAVDAVKQRRIRLLAEVYLLKHYGCTEIPVRFDVMEVFLEQGGEPQLNFIPDAF